MSDANFTEIDTEALRLDMLRRMEERTGEPLYPGDERRIFAEALAYALGVFASAANEQCKARLLAYAKGYQLDALGERVNCRRIAPVPATVQLTFTLATARPNAITIPAGTTVTADNKVLFATSAAAVIPPGATEASGVPATATVGGSITNGVPAGAIQSFVDKAPYVTGVINTTESSGGDDGEPYPLAIDPDNGDDGSGDDNYRERIRLAVAGFSCAGGAASYEYFARSASANVEGVSVISSQAAGTVDIYITEHGGASPSEGTLSAVTAAVTDDAVKPLNDLVRVHAPDAVPYDIELCYYVEQADESTSVREIEGEGGLLAQYNAWQQGAIGRDINPQRLMAYLLRSCLRLDIVKPAFATVSDAQIARWSGKMNISHILVSE